MTLFDPFFASNRGSLEQIIQRRQQGRMDSLIASIESKYAKPGKKAKAAAADAPEISEEEFQALQSKMFGKGGKESASPKRQRR